ncbi:uncharacterized protein LOC114760130 [Neltuma alba]|uniref:uncharacterized protein LOC114760130 n=1 Tax=Neltuma alba TaxID=207710 RepID=UPI0010A4080B|nr:uncharacterized protein LOC114760130 [Prosopis alba]
MAAKVALSCSLSFKSSFLLSLCSSSPSSLFNPFLTLPRTRPLRFKLHARLGGEDSETKKGGKKKFITRDEEPQQYWQTAGEREGENPMKTPLPYIIIFGMSTPFVILAIAFANGWIKVPVR